MDVASHNRSGLTLLLLHYIYTNLSNQYDTPIHNLGNAVDTAESVKTHRLGGGKNHQIDTFYFTIYYITYIQYYIILTD